MNTYQIEQYDEHLNHWEAGKDLGDIYHNRDEAIADMTVLHAELGWTGLRVVELPARAVVASTED